MSLLVQLVYKSGVVDAFEKQPVSLLALPQFPRTHFEQVFDAQERPFAPGPGAQLNEQLRLKGFAQIGGCPSLHPGKGQFGRRLGGHHQADTLRSLHPEGVEQGIARTVGQVVVQHGHVVRRLGKSSLGLAGRKRHIRHITVSGECLFEQPGQGFAVLDDQHPGQQARLFARQQPLHLGYERPPVYRGRQEGIGSDVGGDACGVIAGKGGRDHQDGDLVVGSVFG